MNSSSVSGESLGDLFLWEGFTRFVGYMSSWLKADPPNVSNEVQKYLRASQLARMKSILVRK